MLVDTRAAHVETREDNFEDRIKENRIKDNKETIE